MGEMKFGDFKALKTLFVNCGYEVEKGRESIGGGKRWSRDRAGHPRK